MQGNLEQVPLEKCVADDTFNTRQRGLGDLTDLMASIEAVGIKVPLLGKNKENNNGEIEIYAGFRRLAAARELNLPTIPVVVVKRRAITRQKMLLDNVSENLHRNDLNPVDEAYALQRLQSEHSMSTEAICAQLGLKLKRVQSRFRLLKLLPEVRDALHDDRISVNSAFEIDRLPEAKQLKFIEIAEELNGSKLKAMVDTELEKIQRKIELGESGGDKKKKEAKEKNETPVDPASSTENAKLIRKAVAVICESLGYEKDAVAAVQSVNFKVLEPDALQTVARLFDDIADQVEEDVIFNDKAQAEIISYVETGGEEFQMMYDVESPAFRSALSRVISERAAELAREKAKANGNRPKVSYALARQALDEFFCPYELHGEDEESASPGSSVVQA